MINWSAKVNVSDVACAQAIASRSAAYRAESDHLKMEADYDAAIAGQDPDYTIWLAKVKEIKERFPLS